MPHDFSAECVTVTMAQMCQSFLHLRPAPLLRPRVNGAMAQEGTQTHSSVIDIGATKNKLLKQKLHNFWKPHN